jgi:hypothetical protein
MAQIIREIRVDVSQPNVFQAIVAKQLDCNSRFLKITLVDFGVKIEVPKTAKVTINANRPDGKSQSFMGVANNDGTITVPLAQWMLEVAGELKCDVSVINTTDNKRLTSTDFYVNVQEAANKSTDISENPDGEIRVITPTQKIDENSSDDEYPSAKAVYELDNITASASGKAITIDSAEAPLQNLKLYGKTTQDGTLGENILPYPYTAKTQTINGVTFTDLGDGRIQVSGTASADTTYEFLKDATIDGLVVGRTYRVTGCNYFATNINFSVNFNQFSGTTHEFPLLNGEEFTAVATGITGLTATLSVLAGQTINTTIHPKLEVASVNLVSVGDSGSFEVGVYGRNLFNSAEKNFVGGNWQGLGVFAFKKGVKYTISLKATQSFTGYMPCIVIWANNSNVNQKTNYGRTTDKISTLVVEYDKDTQGYIYIQASNGSDSSKHTVGGSFIAQVELGENATPYEPFGKQTLTIPYNLRSTKNTKDEINFENAIAIEKTIKIVFTGNEEMYGQPDYAVFKGTYGLKAGTGILGALSNRLTEFPATQHYYNKEVGFSISNEADRIRITIGNTTTLDEVKAKLAEWYAEGNPLTIIAEIATPIETPLTESELNAYRQLITNKGTTNILCEADMELDYYINKPNAQAVGNLHTQINKDYFKLQQAIISTGGSTL